MSASVVVVGGGPAGALLAYLLASRGIAVTLVERHVDFAREFRGEGLVPGGQKMFREAGLWAEFEALPSTVFERAELHFKGRPVARVRLDWQDRLAPRFVSQPAMLEMLVDQASRCPSFTLRRGGRVTGPVVRDGRVVGVELAIGGAVETLEADYVFACDGRFSTMRTRTNLDHPCQPQSFDVVWCKVPMPGFYRDQPATVRVSFGGGHFGIFIPTYDGRLQIGWVIPKDSYPEFRARGITGWMGEIARWVADDMADHLRTHAGDPSHPFRLDVVCDNYQKWSTPGLLLVGDAAHPMSPVGAQGINIALRDAVVAANHFVPMLRKAADGDALDVAGREFRRGRMPEVSMTQRIQRRIPLVILGRGLWVDVLMTGVRGLSFLGILECVADWRIRKANPLMDGFSEVRLEV